MSNCARQSSRAAIGGKRAYKGVSGFISDLVLTTAGMSGFGFEALQQLVAKPAFQQARRTQRSFIGRHPVDEVLADRAERCAVAHSRHQCRLVSVQCRSDEHTSELQSLIRISYAVFCL